LALMEANGELPKERILDIAKSVGLDTAQLERDMTDPMVAESIAQSTALANRLNVNGTPTFMINDRIIMGELRSEELQSMVKAISG
jgi:predicted DsbA family dithiol-disulfide isomerase